MAPMVQFKPAVPVKHWTDLNKTKVRIDLLKRLGL